METTTVKVIREAIINGDIITKNQALFGALIGALAAIGAQVIIFLLNSRKEKRTIKKQLLASERGIAYLIAASCDELINYRVNSKYWHQLSEIYNNRGDSINHDEAYKRHLDFDKQCQDVLNKYHNNISEYYKAVTHFLSLGRIESSITDDIELIRKFEPKNAKVFPDVKDFGEAYNFAELEKKRLGDSTSTFFQIIDSIHSKMKKGS